MDNLVKPRIRTGHRCCLRVGLGAATAFAAALLTVSPPGVAAQDLPKLSPELEAVRDGLSRFEDPAQADTEVYVAIGCVDYGEVDPADLASMLAKGVVPGEMELVGYGALMDGKLDPERPEALIYTHPKSGESKLAAAVWMVTAAPGVERPTLFGQPFDGPVEVDGANPLQHVNLHVYELFVWLWMENPAGLFHHSNPDLPCYPDGYSIKAK